VRLLALLLLAGCAGHEALRWRPPEPKPRGVEYCEIRGVDRDCKEISRDQMQRILDRL